MIYAVNCQLISWAYFFQSYLARAATELVTLTRYFGHSYAQLQSKAVEGDSFTLETRATVTMGAWLCPFDCRRKSDVKSSHLHFLPQIRKHTLTLLPFPPLHFIII